MFCCIHTNLAPVVVNHCHDFFHKRTFEHQAKLDDFGITAHLLRATRLALVALVDHLTLPTTDVAGALQLLDHTRPDLSELEL